MQISRCLLVLCAAFCALSVRGDNEAQKKAREALNRLSGLPSQPAPAPAPTAVEAPRPVTPPPTPAPEVAPVPAAVPAADADAIARAREALRQKMQSIGGERTVAAPPPPPAPAAPPPPAPAPVPPPAVSAAPAAAAQADVFSEPITVAPVVADPAAISKARNVMRERMQEVISQEPLVAPPAPLSAPVQATVPSPSIPVVATPVAAPAPAPPVVVTTPPAAIPQENPEAVAKAREALRLKMQELTGQPGTRGVATSGAPTAASTAGEVAFEFPAGADEQAIAKAREAMRARMQGPAVQPSPGDSAPKARVASSASRLEFPRLEGPPLPISLAQQQKLAELLQRYKADEISPEEYHSQRAKILAGE